MNLIDFGIVCLYFAAMLGLGFAYRRRAADSLGHYFLGGKQMHWLVLSMSGSVSNFDITGTMWIVALISLFGMKSMWNHWMWGFLMGAFFLAFMGKWIRRSGVMTGAEWMVTRFGTGPDGAAARSAYALMAVVTMVGFIGYAFQGIGKFASVYVEVDPRICALTVFAITTTYVLLGGLYSVVITDVIQTIILTISAIVIMFVAYQNVSPEMVAEQLPRDWLSLLPTWKLDTAQAEALPEAYEVYEFFGALVIVWVMKGLLLNLGGPAQMYDFQRFLAARDPRDAAKVGAAWSLFLVVRWGMAMGIALLAVTGVVRVADPEQVMPVMLQEFLPVGVRGVVVAGLLAAFMSTFSSTINSGASYIVRDLWQPLIRPDTSEQELIRASYVATLAIVVVGIIVGLNADSIRSVFDWIMGALGAAFLIPNVLRWFWWRLNGWGYAIGTLAGLAASLAAIYIPGMEPLYVSFPVICLVSIVATFLATWSTPATPQPVLVAFYVSVRPFGWWGPIRAISHVETVDSAESLIRAATNVGLGMVAIFTAYVAPMFLVSHDHMTAALCALICGVSMVILKSTWYDKLPAADAGG